MSTHGGEPAAGFGVSGSTSVVACSVRYSSSSGRSGGSFVTSSAYAQAPRIPIYEPEWSRERALPQVPQTCSYAAQIKLDS